MFIEQNFLQLLIKLLTTIFIGSNLTALLVLLYLETFINLFFIFPLCQEK